MVSRCSFQEFGEGKRAIVINYFTPYKEEKKIVQLKVDFQETSLAAHWIRLQASTAGREGSIPARELRSRMPHRAAINK